MKGLIGGFEPFGTLAVNPSVVVADQVASQIPDCSFIELPTSFRGVVAQLDAAVERVKPDYAILFGYASSAHGLRLERYGRGLVTSSQPDNDGEVLKGWRSDGPTYLATQFDVPELIRIGTRATGGAVEVYASDSAGGFVCNFAYHHMLRRWSTETPTLFIHLSAMPAESGFEVLVAGATAVAMGAAK